MCGLMCQFISYNRLIVYYHTIKKVTKKCGTISVNLLWLWWSYALDPAYRRVTHGVRVTAMCWVVGIRPPQPMVEADAARRHGGTTKTKIISARGPLARVVRRNSTRGCHAQKEPLISYSQGCEKQALNNTAKSKILYP